MEELKRQIQEQNSKITKLTSKIEVIEQYIEERKIQQLSYPLDNVSIDIIDKVI